MMREAVCRWNGASVSAARRRSDTTDLRQTPAAQVPTDFT
jgi:hypothetical protein